MLRSERTTPVKYPPGVVRPRTRADCVNGPRPCPFVSCRHHLAIDITGRGSLRVDKRELADMPETCSLDVADRGETTLEEIGRILGFSSKERARQILEALYAKVRDAIDWTEYR